MKRLQILLWLLAMPLLTGCIVDALADVANYLPALP